MRDTGDDSDTDEFEGGMTTDEPATAVPDPRDRRRSRRRSGTDRRTESSDAGAGEDSAGKRSGEDRRKGDRRQEPSIPPLYRAGERRINEYPLSAEELEFINAMNAYKHAHDRPFPTWSEVLHVLRALGYSRATPALRPGESADSGDQPAG